VITYDEVQEAKSLREDECADRHAEFKRLRDFWHGRYWEVAQSSSGGVSGIFRDLFAQNGRANTDVKLVHNILQEVCVKYQAFLSPTPMARVYTDPPESQRNRSIATKKERFIYSAWSQRPQSMPQCLNKMGWYLPLMGDAFLGAIPDLQRCTINPVVRSPEYAYPGHTVDGSHLDDVIFCQEIRESKAMRTYPKYEPAEPGRYRPLGGRYRRAKAEPTVEVLEYSDGWEVATWVGEQKIQGVQHDFGFNLYDQVGFITVPDETWNHGAVEQAVGLVEMGNAFYSLMFQSMLEHVFPTLFLINPMKMGPELDLGPGGVVPINEGGDAKWLTPPTQTLQAQLAMLGENERAIKQATSMPDVNFGQFNASIVTGKAINELQGAGTGSTIEMVQGNGIGPAIVSWNEKALTMARRMFAKDTLHLFGVLPLGPAELNPKQFAEQIKGAELRGSTRNEVVFSPHMAAHEKVIMGLQMAGAGLVSKQWQREQAGISDNQAMQEQIVQEAIEDGVLGFILQSLQQAAEQGPEMAQGAEERAFAFIEGRRLPPSMGGGAGPGAPAPPGLAGGPPAGAPSSPPAAPGGPPPAGALPPGPPPGPAGAPPAMPEASVAQPVPGQAADGYTLDEVVQDFQSLEGIEGRVFLIGEIVSEEFARDLEVAVTVGPDRQRIVQQLPEYRADTTFRVVPGEPRERFIEVTPGADPTPGGPDAIDLDAQDEAPLTAAPAA